MIKTGLYKVCNYKEIETKRGCYWECEIFKGDKKIGSAYNSGVGGLDVIKLEKQDISDLKCFFKNVKLNEFYNDWTIENIIHALCDNFQELN